MKKEITVPVTNGVADLTNYVNGTTDKIYLADLRNTPIYLASALSTTNQDEQASIPYVGSYGQLQYGRLGGERAVFLDGYFLRFRNADGSLTSLTGTNIKFTVPAYPASITAVPATLQEDFINFTARYVRDELGFLPAGGGENN